MTFFRYLHESVGNEKTRTAGFFFLFFVIICGFISTIFVSVLSAGFTQVSWPWYQYVIGFLISLLMSLITVGFLLVTLTCFFGRRINDPGRSVTILFRLPIIVHIYGPWKIIPIQKQPQPVTDIPWSWTAFAQPDQLKLKLKENLPPDVPTEVQVLEAAVWNLLARGKFELKTRSERYSYFFNLIQTDEENSIYVSNSPHNTLPTVSGYWERQIINAVTRTTRENSLIFDVIVEAFGESAYRPGLEVIKRVQNEHPISIPENFRIDVTKYLNQQDVKLTQLIRKSVKKALQDRIDPS